MNLIAGGVLLAFSALVFTATADLARVGNGEIGPGFFPTLCAALLAAVGATLVGLGVRDAAMQPADAAQGDKSSDAWRAAVVTAAVLAFAVLLKSGGLAVAVFVAVWLSTRAGEVSHRTALVLSVVLALVLTAIFTVGLRLHMPALPAFLG